MYEFKMKHTWAWRFVRGLATLPMNPANASEIREGEFDDDDATTERRVLKG